MRSLAILLAGLGTLAGIVVGLFAHHAAPHDLGWTLYQPPSRTDYADYVPQHTAWFPGIVEYGALGLGTGLVLTAALGAMRFRLVRTRPNG